jgi:NDP-sugar pyrophosphorylase family protein
MNYAIIAAGEGERLKSEGVDCSKPLVPILGMPLIGRILKTCVNHEADFITCIINEESLDVRRYLQSLVLPVPLNLIIQSTPSSMHSLYRMRPYLESKPFILMTTDSVFHEKEFDVFFHEVKSGKNRDGIMAVTDFVDDEKPLYVEIDEQGRIEKFSDSVTKSKCVTGGMYYFEKNIYPVTEQIIKEGGQRLRLLLKKLADRNYVFQSFQFSKIIDVDHASDIAKAEAFLSEGMQ